MEAAQDFAACLRRTLAMIDTMQLAWVTPAEAPPPEPVSEPIVGENFEVGILGDQVILQLDAAAFSLTPHNAWRLGRALTDAARAAGPTP